MCSGRSGPGSTTATSARPIRYVFVPVNVIGDGFGASIRATRGVRSSRSPLMIASSGGQARSPRRTVRPQVPAVAEAVVPARLHAPDWLRPREGEQVSRGPEVVQHAQVIYGDR